MTKKTYRWFNWKDPDWIGFMAAMAIVVINAIIQTIWGIR